MFLDKFWIQFQFFPKLFRTIFFLETFSHGKDGECQSRDVLLDTIFCKSSVIVYAFEHLVVITKWSVKSIYPLMGLLVNWMSFDEFFKLFFPVLNSMKINVAYFHRHLTHLFFSHHVKQRLGINHVLLICRASLKDYVSTKP